MIIVVLLLYIDETKIKIINLNSMLYLTQFIFGMRYLIN